MKELSRLEGVDLLICPELPLSYLKNKARLLLPMSSELDGAGFQELCQG